MIEGKHWKNFSFCMIGLVGWLSLSGQMTVKQDRQPTALVKEVLIGKGILIDNVRFSGMIDALGEFQNPSAQPFFSKGIVLSTGKATDMVGPNDSPKTSTVNGSPGDKNLAPLAGGRTFDGAKLEFDFKADKDSITLNFIFASEEYHDYVGSSFNDVFAIAVSGSNLGNGKNLAVLPGTTTPITVNTVNPNQNRQFYVENNPYTLVGRINESVKASLNPSILSQFEYDGLTKVFSVGLRVTPKQVYHFEVVVADAGDGTVDSAVLLEGGSFRSLEQQKHAAKRLLVAEQRRQDSLARVQLLEDSLSRAQAKADSLRNLEDTGWETPQPKSDTVPKIDRPLPTTSMEELRRSNQARLDSMARAEKELATRLQDDSLRRAQLQAAQRQERLRQDSIYKEQERQAIQIQTEQRRQDSIAQVRIAQNKAAAEQRRQDSISEVRIAQAKAVAEQRRQDSISLQRVADAKAVAEQRRQDSINSAKAAQPKVIETQPTPAEVKEIILFEPTSYFVPADGERRMRELGMILKGQPELRVGIYLPQGETIDVLNMRYDMLRFELLKAGAKPEQIFRNGFSFSPPATPKNPQKVEVWLRKE